MDRLDLKERFRVLTEGAKYDVSCSSSGSGRGAQKGMSGLCNVGGVCHSFTADGRCISLLKILMTNHCIYDCKYCVNRVSSDVERAMLSPAELCSIVMEFYRRNYIEGLFLSSAVFRTPDYTMELMLETVQALRQKYRFNGYIHMKGIPGADPKLIEKAAAFVERMSINMELPTKKSLQLFAPQKAAQSITTPIRELSELYAAQERRETTKMIPAGQTSQMIVGASPDSDGIVLKAAERLYRQFSLKRVYYSAYVPIGDPKKLPTNPPDMIRENRLYQADWLLRFYGFDADELLAAGENLPQDIDPKSNWALRHIEQFPVDVNRAPYEMLLRVPGIGVKSAWRILQARKYTRLRYEDLVKMRVTLKRAVHFITFDGKYFGVGFHDTLLRNALTLPAFAKASPEQLNLFSGTSALVSEL